MKYFQIAMLLLLMSCNNEKVVQLPEINQSDISEILDVSPAYLFYDETKEDSVELNRRTLIITTNWLINVDKRLTLKQAIPKIIYLQDKKRNAELHKNEEAKNYYTCHNTSINNLGFIEFTNVYYIEKQPSIIDLKTNEYAIVFHDTSNIEINSSNTDSFKTSKASLLNDLDQVISKNSESVTLHLFFNNNLSFQDYISFKSKLNTLKDKNVTIANEEFISN
ncbi:hypothetical protein [Xanthomarina sp. F2636L]|uniref:hypothetical protein n=1 Tax=Xanthomarina sp. F2636L TaxID=2996018 RepID=UPI00225E412C|nr:hypothetical protein [Xanthomarina sp. F2636L]MCX7551969.1 hypothetical protein [Xanthomarina sp. F2636L]